MTIQDAFNKICAEDLGSIWIPFDFGVYQTFACEYEMEFGKIDPK